jgi:hypothetical protein
MEEEAPEIGEWVDTDRASFSPRRLNYAAILEAGTEEEARAAAETPAPAKPAAEAAPTKSAAPAAEAKPAPAPAETPAEAPKTEAPAAPAKPATPEEAARNARYKTASLVVGEAHVELCAKRAATLGEIAAILRQPGLLSGDEIKDQTVPMWEFFEKLGFPETTWSRLGGFCMAGVSTEGYITGNESMRQQALQGKNAGVDPFQAYQPPDKARIAGAGVLVELNSLVRTVESCAVKCSDLTDAQKSSEGKKALSAAQEAARAQVAGRKQVIEGLLEICNKPEHQVASLEWCIGGNNVGRSPRIYNPLLSGVATALDGVLMDPDTGEITAGRLQELRGYYGSEFVEQMVKIAYRSFPGSTNLRRKLKAAYKEYCDKPKKTPTDLDGLLFNAELRTIRNELNKTIEFIKKSSGLSESEEGTALEQCQENMERKFQAWLSTHKQVEDDGSITIDVGHIKIMVNDEEQLKHVTLQSLTAL